MGNKEYANYEYLFDDIKDAMLKKRAQISLKYYITNAEINKVCYNVFSLIAIVLPSVATILSCTKETNIAISIISGLTAIVSGLLALFKFADKKVSYRDSAENLKSELNSFHCNIGNYHFDNPEEHVSEREEKLAERVEQIIKKGYNKISDIESRGTK